MESSSSDSSGSTNGSSGSTAGGVRYLSDSYVRQIGVLKALSEEKRSADIRHLPIDEIATRAGLKDEKEAQRCLYILEGAKLVAPFPPGDFTSRNWHITDAGRSAFEKFNKELNG